MVGLTLLSSASEGQSQPGVDDGFEIFKERTDQYHHTCNGVGWINPVVHCKISDDPIYIDGIKYHPFIWGYEISDTVGYLRYERDRVYFKSVEIDLKYAEKEKCEIEEHVFLDFSTNLWEDSFSIRLGCMRLFGNNELSLVDHYYDESIKDSIFEYRLENQIVFPHMYPVSKFYVSRRYGFIKFVASSGKGAKEGGCCITDYYPDEIRMK